jgi:hypothetical protein
MFSQHRGNLTFHTVSHSYMLLGQRGVLELLCSHRGNIRKKVFGNRFPRLSSTSFARIRTRDVIVCLGHCILWLYNSKDDVHNAKIKV